MTTSLPSKRIAVVDVPEVEQFTTEFVYNFFVPDERANDSGTAPNSILKTPSENFDSSFISGINRVTPRYVKFIWKPTLKGQRFDIAEKTSIEDNIKKIHNEQTFTTDEYTNVLFQDSGLDNKLSFFIEEALEQLDIRTRRPGGDNNPSSLLDLTKIINENTPPEITGDFLTNSFNNLRRLGVKFLDSNKKKELINDLLGQVKSVETRIQLNNKIIAKAMRSVSEDPVGIFSDEAKSLYADSVSIEQKAIGSKHSAIINGLDYDFEIYDIVGYRKIDTEGYDSVVQVVGYLIEKEEILPDGKVIAHKPIVVENPLSSTTIDIKIKYGSTYTYKIKTIAFVELQAEEQDANSVIAVSFLVSSKTTQSTVTCVEEVPPPSPADFNVNWDYNAKAARIMWSFPNNSQRDIKKFQVFRRKTIFEPFQLIKMFDFDDSTIRSPYYETPEHHLVEMLDSPKTYYLDREFNKDAKYIYTVCSIDAHGFSSNYGPQYEVSFDRFQNKLIKRLISTAGSPKAYPNAYLQQDTFVDTIKDSGHKRVKVIFNPEYIKVKNKQGSDLQLLKTDLGNASYRFQMINIDLQSQKVVNITLLDRRETEQKK